MIFTFANKITVLRILAVPAFIVAVLYYSPQNEHLRVVALGIFLFATISDLVDGYIARRFDQRTQIGTILDPLADKMLLVSAFVCMFVMRDHFGAIQLPFWLLIVVISRDVILLSGVGIMQLIGSQAEIEPTMAGKLTTFFQVMAVFGIFFQWSFSIILWWIILVLAIATTIDYIKRNIQPTE